MIYHVATRWYPLGVYVDLLWCHDVGSGWSVCLGLN